MSVLLSLWCDLFVDKPEFVNAPFTQIELTEGESAFINITARGNPNEIVYEWKSKGEEKIDGSRFSGGGPVLSISRVERYDSGVYQIQASNDQGTTETSIVLNVRCKFWLCMLWICISRSSLRLIINPFLPSPHPTRCSFACFRLLFGWSQSSVSLHRARSHSSSCSFSPILKLCQGNQVEGSRA